MNNQFAQDVRKGLSTSPKRLPSKYFYDHEGDKIFQAIMDMPEYYLTRTEYEILETNKKALLELFKNGNGRFNLIEFGAGDGLKTKILLRYFAERKTDFSYFPIDISGNVLRLLDKDLKEELPELQVNPIEDDYFKALNRLKYTTDRRSAVLFLGSNIGNFTEEESLGFLKKLGQSLNKGDLVLVGFDLKKDPEVIRNAYNDKGGVTRDFNLNLLKRINRELGGNFNMNKFQHYQMYNPLTGEARSFLISREQQEVQIAAIQESFRFNAWEPVHVEISRKYSLPTIVDYAQHAGFRTVENFFDHKHYFVNTLWEKE